MNLNYSVVKPLNFDICNVKNCYGMTLNLESIHTECPYEFLRNFSYGRLLNYMEEARSYLYHHLFLFYLVTYDVYKYMDPMGYP